MGESSKIISDPQPISAAHARVPEEDATPTSTSSMSVEEAWAITEKLLDDLSGAQSLSGQALEAAVVLKNKDAVKYGELAIHVKESPTSANTWHGLLKDKERSLRTKRSRASGGSDRPIIVDRADLHLMVDEACVALEKLGDVYERGGELVEVVEGLDDVKISPIKKGRVGDLLSRAARFESVKDDSNRPIKPPGVVVDSVHARGTWALPKLRSFVDGACMLKNGDVLSTTGFHPSANLYVRRGVEVPGLRAPTQADAAAAYQHLTSLLVDFELSGESRAAHESAWVALLLTIIARPAIENGSTPLFLFDANRARVGKTRLAQMACEIATGRPANAEAAPSGRGADVEMGKTITGIARAGIPVVFFDNVRGKLGGSSLELAITSPRWSARVLGESTRFEGELAVTWIATSNNCQLTTDMRGRTLLIRIETDLEEPEKRSGFKFPRVMRHVRENRAAYLKSALVMLRAWHVAERPVFDLTPWGSFEEWGEVIRNAILFADGEDPCNTRDELEDTDSEMSRLAAVLEAWPLNKAYKSGEISQAMQDGHFSGGIMNSHHELAAALCELLPTSKANSIGAFLRYHKKKVIGGRRLVQGRGEEKRHWLVEEISK